MGKLSHNNITLLTIIILSLAVKFAFFGYACKNVPSAKFMPDTPSYIEPGINLVERGVFATFDERGRIDYDILRTPGYPLFIGVLHKALKLSFDHIVIVQILLITLAGYIIYRAACELDKNTALLAAFIFLFDIPVMLSALMILTEALYTVFMAFFMFFFLKYLKENRLSMLLLSTVIIALATYIRPVSYYLGICLAGGVIYAIFRRNIKRAVSHALILLLIFYAPLGMWQYRNYLRVGHADFTIIDDSDIHRIGLMRDFAKEKDPNEITKFPFWYYTNRTARSVLQFFIIPGTLKYLRSEPIKIAGKIYGYPWAVLLFLGIFFAGYDKLPYRFLLFTVLYFAAVSVFVTGLCVGSRFRVPAMPLLSILSASGWTRVIAYLRSRLS